MVKCNKHLEIFDKPKRHRFKRNEKLKSLRDQMKINSIQQLRDGNLPKQFSSKLIMRALKAHPEEDNILNMSMKLTD